MQNLDVAVAVDGSQRAEKETGRTGLRADFRRKGKLFKLSALRRLMEFIDHRLVISQFVRFERPERC